MNKDFSELIQHLDEKFNKVDQRFDKIEKDFATKEDLKKFATKEDLKNAVANLSTKDDYNNLMNAVDAYVKKADAFFQELVALSHKVDRHEKWLHQIAEKLGLKLEY